MKRKTLVLVLLVVPTIIFGFIVYPNSLMRLELSSISVNKGSKSLKSADAILSWPFALHNNINENQSLKYTSNSSGSTITSNTLNYNVHAFYYPWYASPEIDGKWLHWNHPYIPPWDKNDHHVYPSGSHVPPLDIGANYYPELGPYSSRDPTIIEAHMRMMSDINVGVIAVSWYPPGLADENGLPTDAMIPILLEAANKYNIKLCLHVEPYEGRNASNFHYYLKYVHEEYGSHPAYYKVRRGRRKLPLFYIYDSYRVTVNEWQKVLSNDGNISVRNTELDALFIGLIVDYKHRFDVKSAGFDGYYTYFAANGFSYGSSWKNWKSLASYAYKNSMIFIPSVGPGYVDTRVRPWNSKNTHARRKGLYYESAWRTAIGAPSKYISITSFNEWHEGTQIEPAIPMKCGNYSYQDYQPNTPNYYMQLTKKWIKQLSSN